MYVLAVDDERIMLKELTIELGQVFPNADIRGFQEPQEAERWASELAQEGKTLDYAFLDIRMRGMSGIELARRLKQLHPGTILIFCTAYTEYAFDAVGMYAKGYLMKPISAQNIVRTLDEMVYDWRKSLEIQNHDFWIKTFGNFEVFVDGQPLIFEREKAKEMLEGTQKKIVNISNEVGYPNVSYFCQSFREYFGVSPQKFRSQGDM